MNILNTLSYIIWDVNPDIVVLPVVNHPLRWYGVLFALGFLVSQQIMYFIYRKDGRPEKEVDTLAIYLVIATVVGARLGHVLFYDPVYYFQNPHKILMTWEGGLASHGGVIGVLIGLYLFARKTKVSYLWALDRVCIVAAFTFSMIRMGNLMNSEMIGKPTDLSWAFIFTSFDGVPRHPAQLYEAIHYFVVFGILFWVWRTQRKKLKDGLLFSSSVIVLFTLRFIDEFFKLNQVDFEEGLMLNMGQMLSIPFILSGVALLVAVTRRKRKTNQIDEILAE